VRFETETGKKDFSESQYHDIQTSCHFIDLSLMPLDEVFMRDRGIAISKERSYD
jgi:hypothetical protein